jgi:hypothetical protein
MRCEEARYQLQLYIDRQLTLRQIRVLEAHLAACSLCRMEWHLLEEMSCSLSSLKFVSEPADLHEQIMQKVALSAACVHLGQPAPFKLFRPSLAEILAAALLATLATLAILLQQPSIRELLPRGNGHDPLSLFYTRVVHMLTGLDANALILALWVVGALLGVCITLAVAGSEMRTQWFKAMMERLPVR